MSANNLKTKWGLTPGVKNLGAFYDPKHQILTMSGDGATNDITYGYEFVKKPEVDARLAFAFMSWVGPALRDSHSFCIEGQEFHVPKIPLPIDLDYVIVYTADEPKGKKVEIKWGGLDSTPAPVVVSAATQAKPAVEPSSDIVIQPIHRLVLLGQDLEITTESTTPSAHAKVKYDYRYLSMIDAGTRGGQQYWTFRTIRAGGTTVYVNYNNTGPIPVGWNSIWDITIFWLGPANHPNVGSSPQGPGLVEPFFAGLNSAVGIVREKYPDAELYDVQLNRPDGQVYPANTAWDIGNATAVFRTGNNFVSIKDINNWWSTWGPITPGGGGIGNNNIQWPPNEGPPNQQWTIGLEKAVELLLADPGTPKEFWSAKLWEGQHPQQGPVQPTYTFTMVDTSTWNVGGQDGKVWKNTPPA